MASVQAEPLQSHAPLFQEFDLASVRELPDSHVWQANDGCLSVGASEPVPVIDLADPGAPALMLRACEEWGVFQLTGHGVPSPLFDRLESQARRLFSLPCDQKLLAARSAGNLSGFGLAAISVFFSKLMWSEGFTISGSPLPHVSKLWPHDHAEFCDVIRDYEEEMKRVADALLPLMLRSLGLSDEEARWAGAAQELSGVLQLNSYPACPDPTRAMGLAAHTDSSLLTLLYQSNTSGLQVLRGRGGGGGARWVTVPPLRGAVVVNVGDMMEILTNGRFKSVTHRAVVNHTQHRISAAFISGPPKDAEVAPAPALVAPGAAPGYRAVTWAEYLSLKRALFTEALASLRS